MRNWKFRSSDQAGFTLIELLIVVAIIGILSTLLLVNFIAVRQRGRDAQRKSNLLQIQSALELYRADQGSYPLPNGATIGNCGSGVTIGSPTCSTTYLKKIPLDPNGSTYYNSGKYFYSSDGTTYTIASCIENTNDKDQNITTTAPTGSTSTCTSGSYYVLQNP